MLTRRLAVTTVVALLTRSVRADPVDQQWTIATEYPASAITGEGIAFFAAAASEGALHVQPRFDAPEGLRSGAMPQAVAAGVVTAADAFAAPLAPLSPIFQLSSLPFLTASSADTARLLALARPAYDAALSAHGLVLLYATPWPPTGLWSRTPIPGPAALQGLRVRTYDSASTTVFAAAGAKPRLASFADALPLLRAGELDALLSSGDGGAGARLWETLPYFTALDYAFPLSLAFCSQAALAALSPPAQASVRRAAAATETRQFAAMSTRVSDNEARMRQNKVQIAKAPELRATLQAAAEPVIASWLQTAGPGARPLLDAYHAGHG